VSWCEVWGEGLGEVTRVSLPAGVGSSGSLFSSSCRYRCSCDAIGGRGSANGCKRRRCWPSSWMLWGVGRAGSSQEARRRPCPRRTRWPCRPTSNTVPSSLPDAGMVRGVWPDDDANKADDRPANLSMLGWISQRPLGRLLPFKCQLVSHRHVRRCFRAVSAANTLRSDRTTPLKCPPSMLANAANIWGRALLLYDM